MASTLYSYQDILRGASKRLTSPQDDKVKLHSFAKLYSALSKYLNYQVKKVAISADFTLPQLGTFTYDKTHIKFHPSTQLCEESGMLYKAWQKQSQSSELSMSKIAEVCMISRDMVKDMLQALISEVANIVKQGNKVLFDFKMEQLPTKILVISKSQQEFIEKGSISNLFSSTVNKSFDQRSQMKSTSESRKSLFNAKVATPMTSMRSHSLNKTHLTSGFSKTRKASLRGGGGLTSFEQDPYAILSQVIDQQQKTQSQFPTINKHNFSFANSAVQSQKHSTQKLEKELRQEQLQQIQQKQLRRDLDLSLDRDVEHEKNLHQLRLQEDSELQEKAKLRQQQLLMRDQLFKQTEAKILQKDIQLKEAKQFEYQFPFHTTREPRKLHHSVNISPKDLIKELPTQHGNQATNYAHRLLKESQLSETVRSAHTRVVSHFDQLKQKQIRDKQQFYSNIQQIQDEEDLKRQMRVKDMMSNRGFLKQQMVVNQQKRDEQRKKDLSYSSGFQWMDSQEQQNTFNNFGPDDNPQRLEFYNRKQVMERDFLRDQLQRQIKENDERRKKLSKDDINYGQKLNELAQTMNQMEQDRMKSQTKNQYEDLKHAWTDQRKQRDELDKIESLFK